MLWCFDCFYIIYRLCLAAFPCCAAHNAAMSKRAPAKKAAAAAADDTGKPSQGAAPTPVAMSSAPDSNGGAVDMVVDMTQVSPGGAAAASQAAVAPVSNRHMLLLCAGMFVLLYAGCLLVRAFVPYTRWTQVIATQPSFIPQYVLCYSAGIWGRQHQLLSRIPTTFGWVCLVVGGLWSVVGYVASIYISGFEWAWVELVAVPGPFWYQAWWTFFEQSFAVLWSVGLLVAFRQLFNKQGGRAGVLITGATYTVYILHCFVIVCWSRVFESVPMPLAGKVTLIYVLAVVTTWPVAICITLIPGARRVL